MAIDFQPEIKINAVQDAILDLHGVTLSVLRLDQIHPVVSGNKWFKLKYNMDDAKKRGYSAILTFGGAFSNHLIATAAAAKAFGLSSVGIIRGLHAENNLTATLQACKDMGMQLHFVSREDYSKKETTSFLQYIRLQYPNAYIVPEGGDNENGRKGTGEIAAFIPAACTHVALAIGTGATFAGIRNKLDKNISMLGFTAMKGGAYLEMAIRGHLQDPAADLELITDYHFGGFAKHNEALIRFMNTFYDTSGIPLDMVYTAKMTYGILELIQQGKFPAGSKIVCIHTGGLQGNDSIKQLLHY